VVKRHIEGVLWAFSIGSLVVAAYTSSRPLLLILGSISVASILIALPLHFYRAWKKWALVTNRREYAVWVGLETVAIAALISLGIYTVISK